MLSFVNFVFCSLRRPSRAVPARWPWKVDQPPIVHTKWTIDLCDWLVCCVVLWWVWLFLLLIRSFANPTMSSQWEVNKFERFQLHLSRFFFFRKTSVKNIRLGGRRERTHSRLVLLKWEQAQIRRLLNRVHPTKWNRTSYDFLFCRFLFFTALTRLFSPC